MRREADHQAIRNRLIEAAADVVSESGIEAATSRRIAAAAHMNESSIFRHFIDLRNLYEKAFLHIEAGLFSNMADAAEGFLPVNTAEKAMSVLSRMWDSFVINAKPIVFLLRYYHSAYCTETVLAEALSRCGELLMYLEAKDGIPQEEILKFNEILLVMSEYILMIRRGLLPNDEITKNRVMTVIRCLMNEER